MRFTTIIFTLFLIFSCNSATKNKNEMGIFDKFFGKNKTIKKKEQKVYNQEVEKQSRDLKIISLLPPETVFKLEKLPSIAICGNLIPDKSKQGKFKENPEFVEFMHKFIEKNTHKTESFIQEALKQQNGYIYIIDFRTPNGIMGEVPPEDIIGAFQVKVGKVIENSYQRNTNHKVFTKNGIVKLPEELNILLIEEILKVCKEKMK